MTPADMRVPCSKVGVALQACATNVARVGQAGWSFDLGNGKPLAARARLDDGWLAFEATPPPPRSLRNPWRLAEANGRLPGLAKLGLAAPGRPILRADTPLPRNDEDDGHLPVTVDGICRGFEQACHALGGGSVEDCGEAAPSRVADTNLVDLVREAGWQARSNPDGSCVVDLEVVEPRFEATVREEACGRIHLETRVARFTRLDATSRKAIGLLLLGASASVRMVRGAVDLHEDSIRVVFEATLHGPVCARRLDPVLTALAVAARSWGAEVRALRFQTLARHFASAQGRALRGSSTVVARTSRR